MTRIILIGYMGAGKTTIGKALSKELGIIFYDLDWYIESRMRKTVSEIFAERGEEGFRQIEYNMLHEVAEFEDVIISCGGGTPCFFDNMDYLNQLLKGKSKEELLKFIKEQLEKREPFYTKAHYTLDVSLMDNYDKIKISVEKIKELLGL